MGLLDRLLGKGSGIKNTGTTPSQAKPKKEEEFFLDSNSSKSLGDVNFMRRSNKIRHTFPGSISNPGNKEMIKEVDSMEAKLEKVWLGLGNASSNDDKIRLNAGVPNPPKKTFAEKISSTQLSQKLKGAASVAVNIPLSSAPVARKVIETSTPQSSKTNTISQSGVKPGSIDPFRNMAKDLKN
uniref:Uncharacterized protein n=1 Tax=Paulinella chromatophora TaxID=39717 RepID=B1X3S9_PAUCH|nr:hypothetical protein PCC_0147 [Paulinella chromatophora]ACB42598.1 hypothetical protein PCC_0147 [Paulinella chromatophora]|eukprot:gb/GEZN01016495.1/.p1 GENE.gb/GEZN01016495.1/~~gb/GEZN01016495.1/.p1  ORF type:complete len:183 (-),score=3.46 gb/GEZN01016495.1/:200-748(-)